MINFSLSRALKLQLTQSLITRDFLKCSIKQSEWDQTLLLLSNIIIIIKTYHYCGHCSWNLPLPGDRSILRYFVLVLRCKMQKNYCTHVRYVIQIYQDLRQRFKPSKPKDFRKDYMCLSLRFVIFIISVSSTNQRCW